MQLESFWMYVRMIALSLAIAFAAVGAPGPIPFSISDASVAVAEDDEDEDEDEDDDDTAEEEGRVVNGQVLGIYTPGSGWAKAPGTTFDESTEPDKVALRIGQTGNMIVHVVLYNPDLLPMNGVRMSDHVSIDGEFQGGTFYGTDLEVTDRCC